MMFGIFYEGLIRLYRAAVWMASWSNTKAEAFIRGRRNFYQQATSIRQQAGNKKLLWFHCSSLGEYEQARPVMEQLMAQQPEAFVLLTFFSPSGYEAVRHNTRAHAVMYLPLDTAANAQAFVHLLRPVMAAFVKYEFWYNYLKVLNQKGIPVIYFSVIIRKGHFLLHAIGKPLRRELMQARRLFVQDEWSAQRLAAAGFSNVEMAGDTRIDRVMQVAAAPTVPESFAGWASGKHLLLLGSVWEADMEKIGSDLKRVLNKHPKAAFVVVPHEPGDAWKQQLEKYFPQERICSFSHPEASSRILCVEVMGHLSSLYATAVMAYVGGGFGKGIHNILEAAVYGIPVMFGPEHRKFAEAQHLLALGTAVGFRHKGDLEKWFARGVEDATYAAGIKSRLAEYFATRAGASKKIVNFIQTNALYSE